MPTMPTMPTMRKTLQEPLDTVLARVPEALAAEGFGVLTEIDMQTTFERKLDVEFRGYRILGACNPKLAQRALATDLEVGVLLPCNVVLYENDAADGGGTVVSIVDPNVAMGEFGSAALREVAKEAAERLGRVVETL